MIWRQHTSALEYENAAISLPDSIVWAKLIRINDQWILAGNTDNALLFKQKRQLNFSNYGPTQISQPINWMLGQPGQDNLSWQLHSLNFMKDFAAAYVAGKDVFFIDAIKNILKEWASENVSSKTISPFAWNDHSTALRLVIIGHVFIFFHRHASHDVELLRLCSALALIHQKTLANEKFYSKGTNHGLDQAFSLYQSSVVFANNPTSADFRKLALSRLSYELQKSFSLDCVHVENSPEYHEVILSSTLQINSFVLNFEGKGVFKDDAEFINSALDFLSFIIRPDGKFPPIGDTLMLPPRNDFRWLNTYTSYRHYLFARTAGQEGEDEPEWHRVFPDSGYAIFRGDPTEYLPKQRPHLVFKCGFLSHYHRQDDDNNIVLFAFGEEWLTDGGLYLHDHSDLQREHFRSHFAHNIMSPIGAKAERRYCPEPRPQIIDYSNERKNAWVAGRTSMFKGYSYLRKVAYNGGAYFHVEDNIESNTNSECSYESYWHFPNDKTIDICGNVVTISSSRSNTRLVFNISSDDIQSIEEVDLKLQPQFGWRSAEYGKLEPCKVIRLLFRQSARTHASYRFGFLGFPGTVG